MKLVKVKPKPSVFPFFKIVDTVTEDNLEMYQNFGAVIRGGEKLEIGDYLTIPFFRGEEEDVLVAISKDLIPRADWLFNMSKGEVLTIESEYVYIGSMSNLTLDAVIVETKEDEKIMKLFIGNSIKIKKGYVVVSGQSAFKPVFTQKEFEEKFDVAA